MKTLLLGTILLLAGGARAFAGGMLVSMSAEEEEFWASLTAEQAKEMFLLRSMVSAEKTFLRQAAPGEIFYDGDVPFAYLPLAERWKTLRDRRISFCEYQKFIHGQDADSGKDRKFSAWSVPVFELRAKRQLIADAICNALEVCTTPEECRAAAEEAKIFIREIIVGDADWRERRKAAETAQIIAETPEGDAREKALKDCGNYYETRRSCVAEAEHSMSRELARIYVKLLFRAFPNDWESVIREFDASLLLRQKPRERLRFVSETFRKEANPAFPQENRLALERIRAAEIELRKNLP